MSYQLTSRLLAVLLFGLSLGSARAQAFDGPAPAPTLPAEEKPLTPEEQKVWEAHFDGVAKALVAGMGHLAQKGLESMAGEIGSSLAAINQALVRPPYRPNVWQKYSDGYYRLYNGRWWILINGKVYPN